MKYAVNRRVLMISSRYTPDVGGVEKHVQRVAEMLMERGYEITVVTSSHTAKKTTLQPREPRVIRMPNYCGRIPLLATLWVVTRLKILAAYEIVHFHDTSAFMFWSLPLVLSRLGRNLFITYHGFERDPVPSLWKVLRKVASSLTRGCICVGGYIEKEYRMRCDFHTLGGVNQELTRQSGNGGAVFVGRLEPDTGILCFVDAFETLSSRFGLRIPLTICGVGSLAKRVEEKSYRSNLDIRMMGIVKEPSFILRRSTLCLAAGYLSILEAMSVGLPVIGAAMSPLKLCYLRSVRDAGAPLSIQTTPEGVAQEIVRVVNDDRLRKSLAARGRAFAATMSWERMTDLYIQLWSKGSSPKPRR